MAGTARQWPPLRRLLLLHDYAAAFVEEAHCALARLLWHTVQLEAR